jgi:hypothetical protein
VFVWWAGGWTVTVYIGISMCVALIRDRYAYM